MDIAIIPGSLIRRVVSSEQDGIHVNAILSPVLVLGIFISPFALRLVTELPHFCLFDHFLEVPCPGCNITLALFQLANFSVEKSISTHPGGVAIVVTVLFQVAVRSLALGRLITFADAQGAVAIASKLFFIFLLSYWLVNLLSTH